MNRLIGIFELFILHILLEKKECALKDIGQLLKDITARNVVSSGAVYTTLSRLIERGFVSKRDLPPRPIRGGRSSYLYFLTDQGREELKKIKDMLSKII